MIRHGSSLPSRSPPFCSADAATARTTPLPRSGQAATATAQPEPRSTSEPSASPTDESDEDAAEKSASALEDEQERLIDQISAASKRGDRAAVARLEKRLTHVSRQSDGTDEQDPTAAEPYQREIERFNFKQAPLYALQITTSLRDHLVFVSVDPDQFCLRSPAERLSSVRAVFEPADRRLRAGGVRDFEMIVGPPSRAAPERSDALAIGADGEARLTAHGRTC
jgi:hypothetical protein